MDEKNNLLNKGNGGSGTSSGTKAGFRTYNSTRTVTWEPNAKGQTQVTLSVGSSTGNSRTNHSFKRRGFRSLIDAEVLDKRPKGSCFRCDEKFGPGHIYPNKQLQVLLLEEGMDEESAEQESKREDEKDLEAF